jgi:hypothetical protein
MRKATHLLPTAFAALSVKELAGDEVEVATHDPANLPRVKKRIRAILKSHIDDLDTIGVLECQAVDGKDGSVVKDGDAG